MKKTTAFMALAVTLAMLSFTPTVSADHGWHDCWENGENTCDPANDGCDGRIEVDCSYNKDINCKDTNDQVGYDECYHKEYYCTLSYEGSCLINGKAPVFQVPRPGFLFHGDLTVPMPHVGGSADASGHDDPNRCFVSNSPECENGTVCEGIIEIKVHGFCVRADAQVTVG